MLRREKWIKNIKIGLLALAALLILSGALVYFIVLKEEILTDQEKLDFIRNLQRLISQNPKDSDVYFYDKSKYHLSPKEILSWENLGPLNLDEL
jgi:hypothetical protein